MLFSGTKEVSCQKTFVDWFFMLAWEDVRQIPRVTFSGHVKNSTREKWEDMFKANTKEKLKLEFGEEITAIQATPWQDL